MSKAILVLDMPESCLACPVGQNYSCILETCIYCPVAKKNTIDLETESRPEWCPLQKIPDEVFENRPRSMELCYERGE